MLICVCSVHNMNIIKHGNAALALCQLKRNQILEVTTKQSSSPTQIITLTNKRLAGHMNRHIISNQYDIYMVFLQYESLNALLNCIYYQQMSHTKKL